MIPKPGRAIIHSEEAKLLHALRITIRHRFLTTTKGFFMWRSSGYSYTTVRANVAPTGFGNKSRDRCESTGISEVLGKNKVHNLIVLACLVS